jgi:Protein of unknown function (DUF3617)
MIAHMMSILPTKRIVLISLLSSLIAVAALPLLAADRQIPGQYEFTVTADGKTQVSTHCVTPDDAKAVNADAKAGREYAEKATKGACSVTTYEVKGDTVSYSMACGDSVRTNSTKYHGDTFDGDTTYTFPGQGKRMVRVVRIKAKRIGVCK